MNDCVKLPRPSCIFEKAQGEILQMLKKIIILDPFELILIKKNNFILYLHTL